MPSFAAIAARGAFRRGLPLQRSGLAPGRLGEGKRIGLEQPAWRPQAPCRSLAAPRFPGAVWAIAMAASSERRTHPLTVRVTHWAAAASARRLHRRPVSGLPGRGGRSCRANRLRTGAWGSVQFQGLAALFGGHEAARRVHFAGMGALVFFIGVHVVMVILVPKTAWSMWAGHAPAGTHPVRPARRQTRALAAGALGSIGGCDITGTRPVQRIPQSHFGLE